MREKILRTKDVCQRLGVSATTLWRWRKDGSFPNSKNIPGSSIQGWTESTVNGWITENFSEIEEK
jgi:predicted DNA-binding transcriptional regulator AlpA